MIKNRVKHTLSQSLIDESTAAIQTLKKNLNLILADANLDDIKSGQYMGTEGGWKYCQDGFEIAEKFPKLYDDEELDINEYRKDRDLAAFLIPLIQDATTVLEVAKILFALTGKDLMDQTSYIRERANKKRGVQIDYAQAADLLNTLFDRRAGKADETRRVNESINHLKNQLMVTQKN
jgi:hypothetical protein